DGKASIQFQGNQGVISIPSHRGNPGQTFQISLSAIQGDQNGSFDCIQQKSNSSLESMGTMSYRVAVHATDDVYDRTRARMTMAEEESKKVCTKEIKPGGRFIGKKVKKVLPPGSLRIPPPVSKPTSLVSKAPGPSNLLGRQGIGHATLPTHLASSSPKEINSPSLPSLSGISRHSPTLSNVSSSNKSSGNLNSSGQQSRVLMSSTTKQSSGAINMPYRDRVIHLLALRPYKKPELIHRLQKDGIREKDKNSLAAILQQVAVMNKDNSYTLARGGWAYVRLEWPFYSDEDKVLLKRNLQQESRANHTSPAVSPASSNPESPGNNQKRSLADDVDDSSSNPNKRKRIAHSERKMVEEKPVSVVKPTLNQQSSPTANRENFDVNADDDSEPDYLREFKQIMDTKQRQMYKYEFNKEYTEYKELHQEVDAVARKFQNLRSQIDQTEEGTPDFEVLKQQVLEEYEAQRSDPKFMERKDRMNYLHHKLGHIKRLIHDFDHKGQAQACS
ncbi:hypothetical protein EGW08_011343, partial [Elysia chlorotica]